MNERLKGKLDSLFDEGRLGTIEAALLREVGADSEAAAYLERLRGIDSALVDAQKVEVPAMFKADLIGRLPQRRRSMEKATIWQDLVMPLYIAAVMAVSFIFRDLLGISALFGLIANALSTSGGTGKGLEIAFMLLSSLGILVVAWAIVASFFGIRSRRITR
jgi:hypothetical protein